MKHTLVTIKRTFALTLILTAFLQTASKAAVPPDKWGFGDPLPDLIAGLNSPDERIRGITVSKLSRLGPQSLPSLTPMLYGPDPLQHHNARETIKRMVGRVSMPDEDFHRSMFSLDILKQIQRPEVNVYGKRFLLEMLSLCGGREVKSDLEKMVGDKQLGSHATFALARIALNERKNVLKPDGPLPAPAAAWTQLTKSASEKRAKAVDIYLTAAEGYASKGKVAVASDMYLKLWKFGASPAERCAALGGVARCSSRAQASAVMMQALSSPDADVRAIASRWLADSPAPDTTTSLVAALPKATGTTKASIVSILGERKGEEPLKRVTAATSDSSSEVRTAAFRALKARADIKPSALADIYSKALVRSLNNGTALERSVILDGIARLGDPSCLASVQQSISAGQSTGEAYIALTSIADRMASSGQGEQAAGLYERIIERSGSHELIRRSAAGLRKMGRKLDVAERSGNITHWWTLGPIPGRDEWIGKDLIDVSVPIDLGAQVSLGEARFKWTHTYVEDPFGMLDFNEIWGGRKNNCGAYAYAEVISPSDQKAILGLGSDDDMVCWLNGSKVYEFTGNRGWTHSEAKVDVQLKSGINTVLIKVLNGMAGFQGSVTIYDFDGKPLVLKQKEP